LEFIPRNSKLHFPRAILSSRSYQFADAAAIEAVTAAAAATAAAGDGARQN